MRKASGSDCWEQWEARGSGESVTCAGRSKMGRDELARKLGKSSRSLAEEGGQRAFPGLPQFR